jgi:phospholipase C
LAEPPTSGSLSDIKHIVLLMQENRSFDHYFGTLAGVRGFNDANAMMLGHGKSVFYQPDPQHPEVSIAVSSGHGVKQYTKTAVNQSWLEDAA